MSTRGGMREVVPRWATALVGALPGLAVVLTLLVMGLTGHNQIFNLSPRDSFLVAGVGSVLVGLVLSLLILCMILIRAVR